LSSRIKHLIDMAKEARIPKKRAGYIEIDEFKDSDLKKGYFCGACVYFINVQGHSASRVLLALGPEQDNREIEEIVK